MPAWCTFFLARFLIFCYLQIMLYSVLDILSKVVFGYIVLLSHEGLDRLVGLKGMPAAPTANYGTPTSKSFA
jgi:hypothetical protein